MGYSQQTKRAIKRAVRQEGYKARSMALRHMSKTELKKLGLLQKKNATDVHPVGRC